MILEARKSSKEQSLQKKKIGEKKKYIYIYRKKKKKQAEKAKSS